MEFILKSKALYGLTRSLLSFACSAIILLNWFSQSAGQELNAHADNVAQAKIAATVNGVAITTDQVERDMARTLHGLNLTPKQKTEARIATLKKLIDQRVAFEFLKKHQVAVGEDEVNLRLEELKAELATVEKTLDDYLKQTTRTLAEFKFETAWQISWNRYLERKLTDDFLESHFNQNKRQMDGTELRVAHLLLKRPKENPQEQLERLQKKAQTIADEIANTPLTWETAVSQHSEAPTRNSGGEIGWIKIDGPMPRSFTNAAFELSVGQISKPVTTRFGVHLIKCVEVKPGKLGWRDILDDVKKSASRAYFDAIVEKHRPEVVIKQ